MSKPSESDKRGAVEIAVDLRRRAFAHLKAHRIDVREIPFDQWEIDDDEIEPRCETCNGGTGYCGGSESAPDLCACECHRPEPVTLDRFVRALADAVACAERLSGRIARDRWERECEPMLTPARKILAAAQSATPEEKDRAIAAFRISSTSTGRGCG